MKYTSQEVFINLFFFVFLSYFFYFYSFFYSFFYFFLFKYYKISLKLIFFLVEVSFLFIFSIPSDSAFLLHSQLQLSMIQQYFQLLSINLLNGSINFNQFEFFWYFFIYQCQRSNSGRICNYKVQISKIFLLFKWRNLSRAIIILRSS